MMATRRIVLNRENVNPQRFAKPNISQPLETVKRSAFGELGNRPNDLKQVDKNGLKEMVTKKPIIKQPLKNDLLKADEKVKQALTKKPLIRQESILKPVDTNNDIVKKLSSNWTKKQTIIDPDKKIKNNPQMVPEYLSDIFANLRELERCFPIRENFLDEHETTSKMRAILVNWIVEVHMNFKCTIETLHICIALIDRYLQSNKKIGRSTLQLVGTSALLIACKYEEICIPDLEDFEFICDESFTKKQILQMEKEILKLLDFRLGRPLSINFLRRYSQIADAPTLHHTLGKYILELALLEYELGHINPSIQAAAACCLSMGILNEHMDLQKLWTPTLVHYTTYDYYDFKSIIIQFAFLICKSEKSKYQAVRKKYASGKYSKISLNPKLNGPLVRKLVATKK